MRKRISNKPRLSSFLIAFSLVFLISLCSNSAAEGIAPEAEKPVHTTVMIYMCGSDLESRFGAASRDISEILASDYDQNYTNVLIMTGGCRKWNTGFDSETNTIIEVGKRGLRPVWRSENLLNMAEGATLEGFLNFCYERYPADRFGLIIWDHGGGPNEGACYDELHDWQTLTVKELGYALNSSMSNMTALESSAGISTLSWIGFDACLMASAETAFTLSGYADYMIASQETEPSSGWDYSFLRGIEYDADAGETGKRIIDSFFAGEDKSTDTLTLSCVSLQQMGKVRAAMENYFDSLYPRLTELTYPVLSHERTDATSFGRAEHDSSADYDLVDIVSLVEANKTHGESGEFLLHAVQEAVLYSQSNIDGANGMSIYHPYFNVSSYKEKWEEQYNSAFSGMPPSYELYIRRFGQILGGDELGDWSGLNTVRYLDENGNICFSLKMSEEQLKHFDHATLLVLERVFGSNQVLSSYYNIWETDYLQPDENGVLSAVYPGKNVYAVDDKSGETLAGPIDYRITEDGRLQICVILSNDNGMLDQNLLNTMYYCRVPEKGNRLTIESICAYNDVTHEYSSRMEIDKEMIGEMGYTSGMFYIKDCSPDYKGEELLGYCDWHSTGSNFIYDQISLGHDWHFEVRDNKGSDLTFVSFQITNTQNRTHSSSLTPVYPELQKELPVQLETPAESGAYAAADIHNLSSVFYTDSNLITLEVELNWAEVGVRSYTAEDIIINGNVIFDKMRFTAWSGEPLVITIPGKKLSGLKELTEIQFTLEKSYQDYGSQKYEPVTVKYEEALMLSEEQNGRSVSSWQDDDLLWKLYGAEADDAEGVFEIEFDICNSKREPVTVSLKGISVENYYESGYYPSWYIPGGFTMKCAVQFSLRQISSDSRYNVRTAVENVLSALEVSSFQNVGLYYQTDGMDTLTFASFHMQEPIPYLPVGVNNDTLVTELYNRDGIGVRLEKLTVYKDEETGMTVTDLGLWLQNNCATEQYFTLDTFRTNNEAVENHRENAVEALFIPPGMSRFQFIKIESEIPADKLITVGFTVSVSEIAEEAITIAVKK